MTARITDSNGFWEVSDNPLSKVGVFDYLGKSISKDLEPDTFYKVYRPESELSSQECIDSFKLIPWTNDHPNRLLGDPENGGVAPEDKGVGGVIGERVYYDKDSKMLKGNIKVFSQAHADAVADGKEELSAGYRCKWEQSSGEYNGIKYDFIQRDIRGNHLASVDDGRCGSDVSVMDSLNFSIDSKEFKPVAKITKPNKITKLMLQLNKVAMDAEEAAKEPEEKSEMAVLQELLKKVTPLMQQLSELNSVIGSKELAVADDDETEEVGDEDDKTESDEDDDSVKKDTALDDEEKDTDGDSKAMDSKEIAKLIKREVAKALATKGDAMDAKSFLKEVGQRDALASKLSHFVGVFDHSEMTHEEVAKYGLKKLGIQAPKGQEFATINGYLHNRTVPTKRAVSSVMDNSDDKPNFIQRHLGAK